MKVGDTSFNFNIFISKINKITNIISNGDSSNKSFDNGFCSICFSNIKDKDMATISPCCHSFCTYCIFEWLDQSHKCPICRVNTTNITYFNDLDMIVDLYLEQKDNNNNTEEIAFEGNNLEQLPNDYCYFCLKSNNYNFLLICDSCDINCCHTSCLDPPTIFIPEGDWYCDFCAKNLEVSTENHTANIFSKERRDTYIRSKLIYNTSRKYSNKIIKNKIKKLKTHYSNIINN